MTSIRFSLLIAMIGISSVGYACSSSDGGGGTGGTANSNNGGNASSNAGSANSNAGSANNGGSTNNGGSPSNGGSSSSGQCDAMDPTGMGSECPGAVECAEMMCQDEYEQCFGAGYLNGNYGGPCAASMECWVDCDCDQTCIDACPSDPACETCLSDTVGGCVLNSCTNEIFACAGGGGADGGGLPGGGATCADLQACCDSLSGDEQTSCQTTYDFVVGIGDFACGPALMGYPTCAQ